jgi:hypothetical protein
MQKYLQQIANTFTKQRRHGFMFVITIVGLGVMMIIGGSFMGSATHQFAASQNDYASLHAMSMSSAGAHYAYWKSKYGGGFPNAYAENLLDDPRALISMTTPTANYQIHKFSPFDADDEFYVWVANIGRWDTEDSAKIGIGYLAISNVLWSELCF